MRRDWDDRARKNAFHYIASWREEWDLASFLASGEEDYSKFVLPVLERCRIPTTGRVMVELGCGAGRMTRTFGQRYERVLAIDLSSEMLQRAREIHSQIKNILWLRVGGGDLACLADDTADFFFSYLVLQHLPSQELAFSWWRSTSDHAGTWARPFASRNILRPGARRARPRNPGTPEWHS